VCVCLHLIRSRDVCQNFVCRPVDRRRRPAARPYRMPKMSEKERPNWPMAHSTLYTYNIYL